MKLKLVSITDKTKFEFFRCKKYGKQRVPVIEYISKDINIVNAENDKKLCYQDEVTRLFSYSDKKIVNIIMSLMHLKIETENEIYNFCNI